MAKNYILKTFTRSILFCFFMLATMGLSAQTTNPTTPTAPAQPTEKYKPQKGGSVQNPNPVRIEYPQAFLTKKGTKTNVPGEYWIDLKIEGRQTEGSEPADVVLLVDRSWSMGKVQNGDVDPTDNVKKPRWHFAREAIKKVLNEIIPDTNSNFNVGMVMFDSFSKFNDPDYRMPLSKDKDALFNSLVNEIQYNRAKAGTNIQAGILNAYDLIKTGNGRQKYIIVIGDGAPSFLSPPKTLVETPTKLPGGYGGVSTGSIIMNKEKPFYAIDKIDDNISLWGGQILPKTLDVTEAPQGTPSKIRILSNEYPIESALYVSKKAQPDVKILAVGVCLKLIDQGRDVLKGLVEDTKKDYYETPSASDLPKLLKAIAKRIVGTVKSGKVTDPMSEKVDLVLPADGSFEKGRDYFLTASAPEVLNPVTVQRKDGSLMEVIEPVTVGQENGTLSIKGLTLTVNEWVNVRYKVRLKDEFRTGELALANDTTTLDYDGYKDDDTPLNFNIPQVELFEGKARLTKTFGGQAPPNGVQATFKLYEKVGEIDTAENGETDDKLIGEYTTNDKGKIEVQKLFVGDYYFKEISTADKYKLVKDAIKFSITGGSRDWQELATVDNPLKIVPKPSIKLEKTTDKATDYKLVKDEVITYTFKVTNTGNVTLTDVKVADPLTDLSAISPASVTTLAPKASTTFTATYVIKQTDVDNGKLTNTATATGTPPVKEDGTPSDPVTDDDTVTVPSDPNPSIKLVKTTDKATDYKLVKDEVITYTFKVTNTGNVTLTDVKVADPLTDLSAISPESVATLAPKASTTFTATYVIKQSDVDNGKLTNTATATGTPPVKEDGTPSDPVTDDDTVTVPSDPKPSIKLVKTTDKATDYKLIKGETITYNFKVTNTGNVTLSNVTVTDPLTDLSAISPASVTTLAPKASTTFTATYVIKQSDVDNGKLTNTATATGTPPVKEDGTPSDPVTDDDTVTVPSDPNPSIKLEKTTDKATDYKLIKGETITYNFKVTNTGNVTLTDVKVADPLTDLSAISPASVTTLAPKASTTFTATYVIKQSDVDNGKLTNTATATGTPPVKEDGTPSDPVTDEDTVTVPSDPNPSIEIIKTADKTNLVVGETITYTFKVTNTGNVTLKKVKVTDPLPRLSAITPAEVASLAPGASTTFTATYEVKQSDVDNGEVKNQATATGNPPTGDPVTDVSDNDTPGKDDDGKDKDGNGNGNDDDPTVVKGKQNPSIEIIKTADKTNLVVGETITYTFKVTNTGNVTLKKVKVTDPLPRLSAITPAEVASLAPGDSTTFTATYKVEQSDVDNGEVKNQATAIGNPPTGDPVTDVSDNDTPGKDDDGKDKDGNGNGNDDDPTVVKGKQNPSIEIIKTADKTNLVVGETITYTFKVTNTGNVTLKKVKVTDPLPRLSAITPAEVASLAPGDSTTFTATYKVEQSDVDNGEVKNQATAIGNPPTGDPVTDVSDNDTPGKDDDGKDKDDNGNGNDDDPTVVKGKQTPSIELIKTADKTNLVVGETITYTFKVTNTGNVTLKKVKVTDPLPRLSAITPAEVASLAPGASTTFTATYEVKQSDVDNGEVKNQATATGNPPTGDPVTDVSDNDTPGKDDDGKDKDNNGNGNDDDPTIVKGTQTPSIEIIKTADKTNLVVGETITYTFKVTNTGNVTLKKAKVTDPLPRLSAITPAEVASLAPGASTTFTATYEVEQSDVDNGEVKNQATATGNPPTGDPVKDVSDNDTPGKDDDGKDKDNNGNGNDDDPTIVKGTQTPSIEIIKTADKTNLVVGETITYTFKVTNTGNVTLKKVKVTDPLPRLSAITPAEVASLAPGASTTFTATYEVEQSDVDNGEVKNQATATGNDPKGKPVEDDDTKIIKAVQKPSIKLVKTADKTELVVGETVTYTFKVTNTGNVTLTDVKVNDPMLGGKIALAKTTLAPNESTTGTGNYVVTQEDVDAGKLTNTAKTTGNPPAKEDGTPNKPVEDDDTKIIKAVQKPSIKLEKTADKTEVLEGETITYTFTITNTGNVTLTNIKVDDPMLGGNIVLEKTTLAPNESTTGTGTYVVTHTDVDAGLIINTAKAIGQPPVKVDGKTPPQVGDDDTIKIVVKIDCYKLLKSLKEKPFAQLITPNGDMKNDEWVLPLLKEYSEHCVEECVKNSVKIFNRWGALVYERENYMLDGDLFKGYSTNSLDLQDGEKLPAGTYFYIVKVGDNFKKTGYIYVIY